MSSPGPLRLAVQLVSGVVVLLGAFGALFLPAPYLMESPGPTFDTTGEIEREDGEELPVITVSGADTYPTEGQLALTTVYVSGAPTSTVSGFEALSGWISPTVDLTPHELVYPSGTTEQEVRERNEAAMTSSQELAFAAALDQQGIDYAVTLFVAGFTEEAEAAGVADQLRVDDQILAAAGEEITGIEGLRSAVNEAAGEPIELTVLRDGEELTVEVPTYQEADGEYYVGILLGSEFDFPYGIDIRLSENVGGPSAGLMFALGIIDTMTEESLTGGEHWAGTGTVDPDGTVGPIGGIPQKIVGARDEGAEYFLAPRQNCGELEGRRVDGLDVYGVDDVDEAVSVVEAVRDGDTEYLEQLPACGS
ncbi:YlbL family protein [Nesterenkonia alba]|uniref:YlbL family protein n=1 Tax=Nesterenkonia alba TaxID=515814 RepID=UPI0003B721FE|nr:S16 family serine protease [Nesterenkonia alba]